MVAPEGGPVTQLCRKDTEEVILRARAILETIIERNRGSLAILAGEGKKDDRVSVRRVLLPGNHDRLALHDGKLYARMREAIGAVDERTLADEGIFPHRLEMREYGVLARHGHEHDVWNFEAHEDGRDVSTYGDEEYLAAPIGDPITTELVARLPYEMKRRLAGEAGLSDADKLAVYQRMQRIEDVRPVFAALQWAYAEASSMHGSLGASKGAIVHEAARDVLRALVTDFRRLEIYQRWAHRHDKILRFDATDQLGAALRALEYVTPDAIERFAKVFGRSLDGALDADPCRAAAARERLGSVGSAGLRFVVYGHTHDPLQAALAASGGTQDVYLNSGTFRQRVFRTDDRMGFIGSEHISYLCFFREAEAAAWRDAGDAGPAYEMWMGARNR